MDEEQALISAGGIDFRMRYRDDIAGDGGLSIEVYAEVEGRDTELLRFDCFQNDPHYHYGPQAGDDRIPLDPTATGDSLQWALERFERGRLKPMLERAGYDAVAEALDEEAVANAMPTVISRAHDLVTQHAS